MPTTTARTIDGLHHFAWRCRDAEENRHFYEDILGMPLVHVNKKDHVPSTGEFCPYVHIFFRMADGSHYFFDPNGLRLELTVEVAESEAVQRFAREAHAELRKWTTSTRTALNLVQGSAGCRHGFLGGS